MPNLPPSRLPIDQFSRGKPRYGCNPYYLVDNQGSQPIERNGFIKRVGITLIHGVVLALFLVALFIGSFIIGSAIS